MTGVDIAVIGAGIQGAGVAQAAAAAGYSVVLIEKGEIGSGTSSKSSKLIHGGLRYLRQGQLGLVRESLREREILLRIAPHLVHSATFLIPVYGDSEIRPWQLRLGLGLYAALGGANPLTAMAPLPQDSPLMPPAMRHRGLKAVFGYRDAQTDDRRLTEAVALSAQALGARLFTHTQLVLARRGPEGHELSLRHPQGFKSLTCRMLVNAAGPWINGVAASLVPEAPTLEVALVKGSHLVLDGTLGESCFYLESPLDRRAVFALPWRGKTLLGTTEESFTGDLDHPGVSTAEETYLLATLAHYFPDFNPPVVERMAGLRVLPEGNDSLFRRSREVRLVEACEAGSGYIAIYGGKLTGYRATAAKVVGRIEKTLGRRKPRANTAHLPLPEVDRGPTGP